jgi:archaellum component FlaG (FlaF/FlaG flagellin family)
MKKILFGLTLILSASVISVSAQTAVAPVTKTASTSSAAAAAISFKEPEFTHDFGAIPQGTPVSYNFVFTNTGKAPLVLSNAVGSCGCTAAEWPKEAIAPGKTGVVKVTYNAASPNTFDRTVTLSSNATNPSVVLHIKGDVKVPATAAQAPTAPPTQSATAPKKN